MKIKLFGTYINRNHDTEYLSANDLMRAGNEYREKNKLLPIKLSELMNRKTTKEFIVALETHTNKKVIITSKNKYESSWLHPYLFFEVALAIHPKLKVQVYEFLYNEMYKLRNNSSDEFISMERALWYYAKDKSKFHEGMILTVKMIKNSCKVHDWETATEDQLELRDRIYATIALLCNVIKDNNKAIRLGIEKSLLWETKMIKK